MNYQLNHQWSHYFWSISFSDQQKDHHYNLKWNELSTESIKSILRSRVSLICYFLHLSGVQTVLFRCEPGKSMTGGTLKPISDCNRRSCACVCKEEQLCNGFIFHDYNCQCIVHYTPPNTIAGNDYFCTKIKKYVWLCNARNKWYIGYISLL